MNNYDAQWDFLKFDKGYEISKTYLDKYHLGELKYQSYWLEIERNIFNARRMHKLTTPIFKSGFEIFVSFSGAIFSNELFITFQNFMKEMGDTEFVIVDDYGPDHPLSVGTFDENRNLHFIPVPNNQFVYPVGITWQDFSSGGPLTDSLFSPLRNYFVYGNSGKWGEYIANELRFEVDIFGLNSSKDNILTEKIKSVSPDGYESKLRQRLPDIYK